MPRYLRLLLLQFRLSLTLGAAYRWDFVLQGALSLVWTALGIVPLYVALHHRPPVEGWSYEQALVVVGWFTILKGVLDGGVNPSLTAVVEHIRKGTLDFVLMKPADAQFLVSTAKFQPWRSLNVLTALGIFAYSFHLLGTSPSAVGVAEAFALLCTATVLLYSLWILTVSAAFYVVKVDNLTYFFESIFDAARWPSSVFRGVLSFIFTF